MPTENLEIPEQPATDAPLTTSELAALLHAWQVSDTPEAARASAGLEGRDYALILSALEEASSFHPQYCPACEDYYNPERVQFRTIRTGRYQTEEHCEGCTDGDGYIIADDTGDWYTNYYGEQCLYWHEGPDEWRTYEPESEDDDDDNVLHDYGTRVDRRFGWPSETPHDSLCFGVELECEPKRGWNQRLLADALGGKDGNGRYILKEDGSLSDGVELVTLPYSLEYHRTQFGWDKILNSGVARVGKSGAGTNSCGMHVHVNRRALSPLTVGKMIVFLNNADNVALVTTIAQRASNGYCSRDTGKKITDIHSGNRYDLLNVSGSHTVEFRLFKGNLRPERVIKNLEFCHALVHFAQQNGIKASARGSKFLQWVANREATYPALHAFLVERELLPRVARPAALIEEPAAAIEDI